MGSVGGGHKIPSLIAGLGVVVAAISAVPRYLALNRPHPDVYFESNAPVAGFAQVGDPEPREPQKPRGKCLVAWHVHLVNHGNAPAENIVVKLVAPGRIDGLEMEPPDGWSTWFRGLEWSCPTDPRVARVDLKKLGTGRILDLRFWHEGPSEPCEAEVAVDCVPATEVDFIYDVEQWSDWRVLRFPGIILAVFLAIGFSWWFICVLVEVVGGVVKEFLPAEGRSVLGTGANRIRDMGRDWWAPGPLSDGRGVNLAEGKGADRRFGRRLLPRKGGRPRAARRGR